MTLRITLDAVAMLGRASTCIATAIVPQPGTAPKQSRSWFIKQRSWTVSVGSRGPWCVKIAARPSATAVAAVMYVAPNPA